MGKITSITFLFCSSVLTVACGQNPLTNMGGFSSATISDEGWEPNLISNPYALLSAEQVFKSYSSVTGVAPTQGITQDYNNRQAVLASSFNLKTVTSPMLIAATNLGSSFCFELITREMALQANQRAFFTAIDFTRGIASVTDSAFQSSIQNMSYAFWGRSPNSQESVILNEERESFANDFTAAEAGNRNSTRELMLFSCTAMLVSFDTISF